jgi:asparagine N-glycosylation enzyme membrane subunit Stt3
MGNGTTAKGKRPRIGNRLVRLPEYLGEDRRAILIILAAAVLIRVFAAVAIEYIQNPVTARDIALIERFALGDAWDASHPPLYLLFLRVIYAVAGGAAPRAVFIIQGVMSSLAVVLMYMVGRAAYNRTTGLIAAVLCAIYPNFIAYNLMAYPDALGVMIVMLMMAATTIDAADRFKTTLSAAVIGIGILIQPLLVYILPGMLLTTRRKLLFLVVVAAILAPWTIRNSAVEGQFTPVYGGNAYEIDTRKFSPTYGLLSPVHDFYYNASAALRKGQSGALSTGGKALRSINYIAAYGYIVIVLLGLAGMARYIRKDHRAWAAPIAGYILLLIVLSTAQIRFRIHLEPLLVLYAALFLVKSYDGLRARRAA